MAVYVADGMAMWRYHLPCMDRAVVTYDMPLGAQVLSVGITTKPGIQLWAKVQPDNAKKDRRTFVVAYTGTPCLLIDDVLIGTVAIGDTVFHVFERFDA